VRELQLSKVDAILIWLAMEASDARACKALEEERSTSLKCWRCLAYSVQGEEVWLKAMKSLAPATQENQKQRSSLVGISDEAGLGVPGESEKGPEEDGAYLFAQSSERKGDGWTCVQTLRRGANGRDTTMQVMFYTCQPDSLILHKMIKKAGLHAHGGVKWVTTGCRGTAPVVTVCQ
jgi:hypothetical protein